MAEVRVPKMTPAIKAGYFVLGFFLNLIGVLIACIVNRRALPAVRRIALRYTFYGIAGFCAVYFVFVAAMKVACLF
ncbi:hypothetical protein BHK98_09155 [Hornefia porci]|uniref:Uncharacterized protein n=1 Tax=Hornefia porci TaxID=2652292 RepID=A0A1Q9JJ82_9FIRM|nr:hypothetical protein [Hornefia porci]OLR56215.1 hypothetical protein BHK98_09155 [Hornefia porci]